MGVKCVVRHIAQPGRVPRCPFYVSMTTSFSSSRVKLKSSSWEVDTLFWGVKPRAPLPLLFRGKMRGWDCRSHRLTLCFATLQHFTRNQDSVLYQEANAACRLQSTKDTNIWSQQTTWANINIHFVPQALQAVNHSMIDTAVHVTLTTWLSCQQ